MTPDDDSDSDNYDPSDEVDPEIRELRAQIRELELRIAGYTAQLDQVSAAVAERARDMEELRAEQAELLAQFHELERRLDREERLRAWLVPITLALVAGSLTLSLLQLF
jgi:uncharacterized coiled-coil DUF342 family protein